MYISGGRFPSSSIMNSKSSKLFFYRNNFINILRTAILGSNFTGFYVKKSVQRYVNAWLFIKNISYEFEEIY